MSPAKKLLEYNPQLILERLSFMTAQGEVVVSAQAKIDGVKRKISTSRRNYSPNWKQTRTSWFRKSCLSR